MLDGKNGTFEINVNYCIDEARRQHARKHDLELIKSNALSPQAIYLRVSII